MEGCTAQGAMLRGEEGALGLVGLWFWPLLSHFGKNIPPTLLLSTVPLILMVPLPASPAFLVSLQSSRPAPSLLVDVCGWAGSFENKVLRGALRPIVFC